MKNNTTKQTNTIEEAKKFAVCGRKKQEAGNLEGALKDYNSAIALDCSNDELYLMRGQVYQAQEELGKALKDYKKALSMNPKCAHYYYNCGFIRYEQQEWDDAREYFAKAAELEPDHVFAQFMCGQACLHSLDLEKAVECFNITERLGTLDDPFNLYLSRASALLDLDRYEEARKDLEKTLTLCVYPEQQATVHYLLGGALMNLGEDDKAKAEFDISIKLDPTDFRPYCDRATVEQHKNQLELALKDLDKALEIEQCLSEIYFQRGVVQALLGDYEEAKTDFTSAIKLYPSGEYYFNRAKAYHSLNKLSRAIADAQKALERCYEGAQGLLDKLKAEKVQSK